MVSSPPDRSNASRRLGDGYLDLESISADWYAERLSHDTPSRAGFEFNVRFYNWPRAS